MLPVMVLACLLLLCTILPAQAEIYKWVDEAGRIHFSDTMARVPAAYRERLEEKPSTLPSLHSQPSAPRASATGSMTALPPRTLSYSIPVRRDGNTMLVDALVGGAVRTRLLVDTGAEFTVLSHAAAQRLGLDLAQAAVIPLRSASGVFLAPLTKVRSLSLGEAVVYDMEVIIHDASPDLDGLLGMSFLDNFLVTIGTSQERLILTTLSENAEAGLYGGRPKDWWQRKFRFYRSQMESVRAYLALHAMPELERTLRYMRTELALLERQALLAGVPRRWRD
ncbi:MAG: aspartyl protease family protein [Candidatus Tectimicrobiota bacterium]